MKDAERASVGTRIKKAREYRGFSQEDVARFLGVSRSSISQMETGSRGIDLLELRRLATLFQCSIGELAGENEPAPRQSSVGIVARAAAADLSAEDQEEVLRFAEFLRTKRKETGNAEPKN